MSAATQVQLISDWVRELMIERGLDVHALAEAAELSDKTIYTVLHGNPVSLRTAGQIYRALQATGRGFLTTARAGVLAADDNVGPD